jgi:electron-transferring-flavoprotein dehydrogenase
MLAAETAYAAIHGSSPSSSPSSEVDAEEGAPGPIDMSPYESAVKDSWIWKELHEVRNLRPSFHNPLGLYGGIAYSGVDSLILRGRVPWTFRNKMEDWEGTKKAR